LRKINDHGEELFQDVPYSEEKEVIKLAIMQNLEEKVFDLIAKGRGKEDAINKSIGNVGNLKRELSVNKPAKKTKKILSVLFT